MYKTIGHLIRMSGLLIEMVVLWAVMTGRIDNESGTLSLPDGRTVPAAWVAVGFGFMIWLVGTMIVYSARSRRRIIEKPAHDRDPV